MKTWAAFLGLLVVAGCASPPRLEVVPADLQRLASIHDITGSFAAVGTIAQSGGHAAIPVALVEPFPRIFEYPPGGDGTLDIAIEPNGELLVRLQRNKSPVEYRFSVDQQSVTATGTVRLDFPPRRVEGEGTAGTVHETVEFHRATSGELLLRMETESELRDFGIIPYHNREIVWARFPRKVPET